MTYPKTDIIILQEKLNEFKDEVKGAIPKGWFLGTEPAGEYSDYLAIKKGWWIFSKTMIILHQFPDPPPLLREPILATVCNPHALNVAKNIEKNVKSVKLKFELGYSKRTLYNSRAK